MKTIILTPLIFCIIISLIDGFTPTCIHSTVSVKKSLRLPTSTTTLKMSSNSNDNSNFWELQKKLAESLNESDDISPDDDATAEQLKL